MAKRILTALACAALCLSLTACGNNDTGAGSSSTASVAQTESVSTPESRAAPESAAPEASETGESDASEESEAAAADGFEQFKAALDEKGYTYETTAMAAEMVGAERGEKYTLDFGTIELYRFADGAEPLNTGEVTLEGFGAFPITVSGNYGAIVNVTDHADEMTTILKGLQ